MPDTRCGFCGNDAGHFLNNPQDGYDIWKCDRCGAPNAVNVTKKKQGDGETEMITSRTELINDLKSIGKILQVVDEKNLEQIGDRVEEIDNWLNKAKKDLADAKKEEQAVN
jgi:hypothetical protein